MGYIGPSPNPGQNREVDDISSGFNGSTTAFTLQVNSQNVSPGSPNAIVVSLGGVVQNPSTDYNIAASTITFTTAPASGLSFFGLVLGQQVDIQSLADGTSPTMSAPSITGDLSIADKIVHTGDTNTAIRFPAADTVTAETGGTERLRIDSEGKVGIGTTPDAGHKLHLHQTSSSAGNNLKVENNYSSGGTTTLITAARQGGAVSAHLQYKDSDTSMNFGTSTAHALSIMTSGTERMRILSGGLVVISNTSALINESGLGVRSGGNTCVFKAEGASGHNPVICWNNAESGTRQQIQFGDGTSYGSRGSITTNGGNVAYGGTSDYRKKQDDVLITDGIEKIKLLKPKRFKWKDALDLGICDGFFAHEVQEVIPTAQAVIGTKDEVETTYYIEGDTIPDGKAVGDVKDTDVPVYQSIDQSKLVPLLTAALQEAITKIETLETKVAALEAA